jgi:hypothetical protein
MCEKYKQSGRNDKYPDEISIWKITDMEKIPEWIIDNCKIKNITADSKIILQTRNTNTGGVEFITADGNNVLFSTKTKDSYACYDYKTKKIFSLTKDQLDLLYDKA